MSASTSMQRIFGDRGALSLCLEGFSAREPQIQMAQAIADCLEQENSAIIEAGTGTGKSLAYLVPAIIHAANTGVRVLVSTNTINLQEQILDKDLNVLEQIGLPVNVALVKGRSNYLCLRKLNAQLEQLHGANPDLISPDPETRAMLALEEWLGQTRTGSLSDLGDRLAQAAGIWEEVCSETDTCMHGRCAFFRDCFFFRSRRQAQEAQILVTNHALLCLDLHFREQGGEGTSVLPTYGAVVIDEAHNLEDVASNNLAIRFRQRDLVRAIQRMVSARGRQPSRLQQVLAELQQALPDEDQFAQVAQAYDEIQAGLGVLQSELAASSQQMQTQVLRAERRRVRSSLDIPDPVQELIALVRDQATPLWHRLQGALQFSRDWIETDSLHELGAYASRFGAQIEAVRTFLDFADSSRVRWFEYQRQNLQLVSAPLDVSTMLQSALFSRVYSAFLVSATLSVSERFDYMNRRLGFRPDRELLFQSPFDYERNSRILLPAFSDWSDNERHSAELAQMLGDIHAHIGGGIFVLMTSMKRLRDLARRLRTQGPDCPLYVQGEMDRAQMLRDFREDRPGILLGVNSFWEGVDVRGAALQCVVIEKIPFAVPSEPLFEARSEALRQAGRDAFRELQLPKAVIRLKQGYGRLIRHSEDRGSCIICDPRISGRSYGRSFLKSLPPQPAISCSLQEVAQRLHC